MRRRILAGAGLGLGGLVAAVGIWTLVPVREVPVIVELQPIVVNREAPPPAPAPAPIVEPKPEPVSNELGCPMLYESPDPDPGPGTRVWIHEVDLDDERADDTQVVASRHSKALALLTDGDVRLSTDDGATFRHVFREYNVDRIALGSDDVLYAVAGEELGVRTPEGRETWRVPAINKCRPDDDCVNRIATVGDDLVWMSFEAVAKSRDRGRTWKTVSTTADAPWNAGTWLFSWRGSVYAIDHYVDRCGVDDSPVWRLSPAGKISHTIFHNYYQLGEPVLRASDSSATTWTWRERCPHADYESKLTTCDRDDDRSAMLMAKTLLPVEGGRTLSVFENSLVELCADGARQIYRRWPGTNLDAVDAKGRPLVVIGHSLYRWSTHHGWHRLYRPRTDR